MSKTRHQQLASWIFGTTALIFLISAYFLSPVDSSGHPIVRLLGGVLGGLFGYFFSGGTKLVADANIPKLGQTAIQASGGAAIFLLVFFGWPEVTRPSPLLSDAEQRELGRTLSRISMIVSDHRWDEIVEYFDPSNLDFQHTLGIELPQYIEEALGLNTAINRLVKSPTDNTDYARLNSIEEMEIVGWDAVAPGRVRVVGRVTLFDETTRRIEFDLQLHPDGKYRFDLPLG